MAIVCNAIAWGISREGTTSGTIARNTGKRMAMPTPFVNTSASSTGAVSMPRYAAIARKIPVATSKYWVARNQRRRSTISASAPHGSASRNIGSVDAVCTRATSTGSPETVVISHAAATSHIHMQMLAASQAVQSIRNDRMRSGLHAVTRVSVTPRCVCASVAT
jgi:hypothetical protein